MCSGAFKGRICSSNPTETNRNNHLRANFISPRYCYATKHSRSPQSPPTSHKLSNTHTLRGDWVSKHDTRWHSRRAVEKAAELGHDRLSAGQVGVRRRAGSGSKTWISLSSECNKYLISFFIFSYCSYKPKVMCKTFRHSHLAKQQICNRYQKAWVLETRVWVYLWPWK